MDFEHNASSDIEIAKSDTPTWGDQHMLKEELICWPGRAEGCQNPREWAVLQDANRHLQQLNYIVKELDVRGAAGSFIAIARSCHPLYAVLVSRQLAQAQAENERLASQLKMWQEEQDTKAGYL